MHLDMQGFNAFSSYWYLVPTSLSDVLVSAAEGPLEPRMRFRAESCKGRDRVQLDE